MRVTLLGTGGPRPDADRQGPATLVEAGGCRLLFDAGRGVATQLARIGVQPEELDAVFVTHHHFDHIGGLGDLLMAAWNRGRRDPLAVYGPQGTKAIVATLFNDVYRADIRYRVREAAAMGESMEPVAGIVRGVDIEAGRVEVAAAVSVEVGRVEHGETAIGLADDEWTAVGYRVVGEGRTVAISGDAVIGKELPRLARSADVLVICCYLSGEEIDNDENRFLAEHVIASGPQVARIAADASCRYLMLTHIREKTPAQLERLAADIGRSYNGEIIVGEDLASLEV